MALEKVSEHNTRLYDERMAAVSVYIAPNKYVYVKDCEIYTCPCQCQVLSHPILDRWIRIWRQTCQRSAFESSIIAVLLTASWMERYLDQKDWPNDTPQSIKLTTQRMIGSQGPITPADVLSMLSVGHKFAYWEPVGKYLEFAKHNKTLRRHVSKLLKHSVAVTKLLDDLCVIVNNTSGLLAVVPELELELEGKAEN